MINKMNSGSPAQQNPLQKNAKNTPNKQTKPAFGNVATGVLKKEAKNVSLEEMSSALKRKANNILEKIDDNFGTKLAKKIDIEDGRPEFVKEENKTKSKGCFSDYSTGILCSIKRT